MGRVIMLGAVALLFSIVPCVNSLSVGVPNLEKRAVNMQFVPNHDHEMWSRDADQGFECPLQVTTGFELNGRQMSLDLKLNDQGQDRVPVYLHDGVKNTKREMPSAACFYRREEAQASFVLRPTERGMHASGHFVTSDGVYGIESNGSMQYNLYQLGTDEAVDSQRDTEAKPKITKKRTANTKYVETVLVFDYEFYKSQMEEYDQNEAEAVESIRYFCVQIIEWSKERFTASGIHSVIPVTTGCQILKTALAAQCFEDVKSDERDPVRGRYTMDLSAALQSCMNWANDHIPAADYVMFVTNLIDIEGRLGMAYLNSMCSTSNSSMLVNIVYMAPVSPLFMNSLTGWALTTTDPRATTRIVILPTNTS